MKQFMYILQFEFSSYLKNKIFVGTTLALVLISGVTLFSPRITALFDKEESSQESSLEDKKSILLVDTISKDPNFTLSIFQETMVDETIETSTETIDELKASIDAEEYAGAIIITSPTSYSYLLKDAKIHDRSQFLINESMLSAYQLNAFSELGIDISSTKEILSTSVKSDVILTGKDQFENYFYTYILIFSLYIAIILYGQLVATNIASEKSSKAMEVLITSAKPTNLIFGKVMGSALAGILQLTSIFGSCFIFFHINKDYWTENMIVNSIFNMPLSILGYTLLFFILGYFIYAFLYGAVGSFASKVEDINTSSLPITLLFIASFFIVMFSMNHGNIDNSLMIVASYIPFTSPMAMFVRIAMSEVPPIGIIASIAILIISTFGIGYFAAKVYRVGVLLYGTPPKFSTILKAMKNSK